MKAKRTNFAGIFALLLVGAVGVYAVSAYIKSTPEARDVPAGLLRAPSKQNALQPGTGSNKASTRVFTPKSSNGSLSFETASEAVPEGIDPRVFAVNRYLENTHITPAGARVLKVEVKDGLALFDCTEALDKTYGTADEMTLIQGLIKTLSQYPEVKRAQFFVSGKVIETWGNVDISQGLDISGDTTSPGGTATPNGA